MPKEKTEAIFGTFEVHPFRAVTIMGNRNLPKADKERIVGEMKEIYETYVSLNPSLLQSEVKTEKKQ